MGNILLLLYVIGFHEYFMIKLDMFGSCEHVKNLWKATEMFSLYLNSFPLFLFRSTDQKMNVNIHIL